MLGFGDYCEKIAQCFNLLKESESQCEQAVELIVSSLSAGNKIIFCGNGGSAADSQHLAAELMGRFLFDRRPLAAISLTVDTSAITAIGNDYGYNAVFSRQLKGLGKKGDVLVAMSTSGNSQNVIEAVQVAGQMGIATIGLVGGAGGKMAKICDICINVPSSSTNHIQEMHIVIGHWLCGVVEKRMCQPVNVQDNSYLDESRLEKIA